MRGLSAGRFFTVCQRIPFSSLRARSFFLVREYAGVTATDNVVTSTVRAVQEALGIWAILTRGKVHVKHVEPPLFARSNMLV